MTCGVLGQGASLSSRIRSSPLSNGCSGMKFSGSDIFSGEYIAAYSFGAMRGSCGAVYETYAKNGLSRLCALRKSMAASLKRSLENFLPMWRLLRGYWPLGSKSCTGTRRWLHMPPKKMLSPWLKERA